MAEQTTQKQPKAKQAQMDPFLEEQMRRNEEIYLNQQLAAELKGKADNQILNAALGILAAATAGFYASGAGKGSDVITAADSGLPIAGNTKNAIKFRTEKPKKLKL